MGCQQFVAVIILVVAGWYCCVSFLVVVCADAVAYALLPKYLLNYAFNLVLAKDIFNGRAI